MVSLQNIAIYATIGMFIVTLIKYATHYYKTKTVKDDWIGHILLLIVIIFLVVTIIAS